MSTWIVDALVGAVIFIVGISLTVRQFGVHNRMAFTLVALLAPLVAVFAVFRLAYLLIFGRMAIGECPPGLEEAERIVELQRQHMFGGNLREPSFTRSWKMAYERELQKDTDRIREFAQKHFAFA